MKCEDCPVIDECSDHYKLNNEKGGCCFGREREYNCHGCEVREHCKVYDTSVVFIKEES